MFPNYRRTSAGSQLCGKLPVQRAGKASVILTAFAALTLLSSSGTHASTAIPLSSRPPLSAIALGHTTLAPATSSASAFTTSAPAPVSRPTSKPAPVVKLVRATAPAPAAASALAGDGIPVTALRAYQAAAAYEASRAPGCRLSWPLLAAIGRVESDHGRFGGAILQTDGESTRKIIGIPLDGRGTALILDTDRGRLDGDTTYDRAVGPMQFIPSTWLLYGVDGNGDGTIDPFNIVDAAFTAARYLCAAGGDLSSLTGQVRAVGAYNHSEPYLRLVLGLEAIYAGEVPGLVVPVLPAVIPATKPAAVPPADQGAPLAASAATSLQRSATTGTSRTSRTTSAVSTSRPAPASSTPSPGPSTALSSVTAPPPTSAAPPTSVAPTPTDSSTPATSTTPTTPTPAPSSTTSTSTPSTTGTPPTTSTPTATATS